MVPASSIGMANLVASTMSLRRAPRISPSCDFRAAAIAVDVGGVEQGDAELDAPCRPRAATRRPAWRRNCCSRGRRPRPRCRIFRVCAFPWPFLRFSAPATLAQAAPSPKHDATPVHVGSVCRKQSGRRSPDARSAKVCRLLTSSRPPRCRPRAGPRRRRW